MVQRFTLTALSSATLLAVIPSTGFGADLGAGGFPAVPEIVAFDHSFRDASFYAGLRGGFGMAEDTDFDIAGPINVVNAYDDFGLVGSAFFGYEVPDLFHSLGLRLEAELGLTTYEVDTHTVGGVATPTADSFGDTFAVTAMANGYVDVDLGFVRPFVGAGVGFARVNFEEHGVTGSLNVMDDSNGAFAWQVMGGLAYDVTHSISVEGMVRYQSIMGVDLSSSTGPESEIDLDTTTLQLGARVAF
ncbi:MAG: outer membrane beta-barrel protein [Pseudomonadota bacterium]